MYPSEEAVKSLLQQQTHRVCFLWEITRKDGTILRLTSHDHHITLMGGTVYAADGGANPTATEMQNGFKEGSFDFEGAIHSSFVTADHLRAGLYDRARVSQRMVDWRYPDAGTFFKQVFYIDRVDFDSLNFTAEILSPAHLLKKKIGWKITKECANEFGDTLCSYDGGPTKTSAANSTTETVKSTSDRRIFAVEETTFGLTGGSANASRLVGGTVVWGVGAANLGVEATIRQVSVVSADVFLHIYQPSPQVIQVGDSVTLRAGCNKIIEEDCSLVYNNHKNFNGSPSIPGTVDLTPSKS